MQLFGDDFADRFGFDIRDPTKIVPEEEVPARRVGRPVLDRVVDNSSPRPSRSRLHPEHDSRDRLHQQPAAAGPELLLPRHPAQAAGRPQDFTHLPVNAPKCPVAHFQQDGHMAMANPPGRVNYEPSSWDPPGPIEASDGHRVPRPTRRSTAARLCCTTRSSS